MMKRFLSVLLVIVLCLSLFPFSVLADSTAQTNDDDKGTPNEEAPSECTVSVTSDDGNGFSLAFLSGGGTYAPGDEVTVVARKVGGYDFIGWYEVGSDSETLVAETLTYTFTAEKSVKLVAKYSCGEKGNARLKVVASQFTVSGEDETQYNYYEHLRKIGENVTINYTGSDGFHCWKNDEGKIESKSNEYTFEMLSDREYIAVSGSGIEAKSALVVFTNGFDQIRGAETYTGDTAAEDIKFPPAVTHENQTFVGWSMTAEEILAEINKGTSYIVVEPVFTSNTVYTVDVYLSNGGTPELYKSIQANSGENCTLGLPVTHNGTSLAYVECTTSTEGTRIISYNPTFGFFAQCDATVVAVYGESLTNTAQFRIQQPRMTNVNGVNRYHVVTERALTPDLSVVSHGIILIKEADCNSLEEASIKLSLDNVGKENITRTTSNVKANQGEYEVNIGENTIGNCYVRGYMSYSGGNSSGTTVVYTDIVYCNFNGDTPEPPVEPEYVAKIGETGYESFADAAAAANDGDVIELLADITEAYILSEEKSISVKLGDKKLVVGAPEGYTVVSSVEGDVTTYSLKAGTTVNNEFEEYIAPLKEIMPLRKTDSRADVTSAVTGMSKLRGVEANGNLNTGREYMIEDTNAAESDYENWVVDYEVSFSDAVNAGDVTFLGNEGDEWVVLGSTPDMAVGTNLRLAASFGRPGDANDKSVTYAEACTIADYLGGAVYTGKNELTMTVKLYVYETDENGELTGVKHIIDAKQFKFGAMAFEDYIGELIEDGDLTVQPIPKTDDRRDVAGVIGDTEGVKGITVKDGVVTLDNGTEFILEDENAADSAYADWTADFEVSFDKNVNAGEVTFLGNYGEYGWVPVTLGAVEANDSFYVLEKLNKELKLGNFKVTYEYLAQRVQDFLCGAVYSGANELTMTVQLVAFDEYGVKHTVGDPIEYTFPATEFDDYIDALDEAGKFDIQPVEQEISTVSVEDAKNIKGLKVEDGKVILENATEFTLDDVNAANTPYADWTADFEVTFDKAVNDGEVVLLGNYGNWGWKPVTVGATAANTPVELLATLGNQFDLGNFKVTYEYLAGNVKDFLCGAYYTGDQELTITVQLVVTDENGTKHNAGDPQTYLFTSFESYIADGEKVEIVKVPATDAKSDLGDLELGYVKGIVKGEDGSISLDNCVEYTVEDAKAAQSPYANWKTDFVVTFNRDVNAGEVKLLGNYGDYDWIPVTVGSVEKNEEVKLLESLGSQFGLDVDVDYQFLAENVKDFLCGAVYSGANEMTMSVQLVAYDEDNVAHPVGAPQTYTFSETTFEDYAAMLISEGKFTIENNAYIADNALAGLETLDPAEYGYEDFEFDKNPAHMKGLQKNADGKYTLLSGREYKITDENAANTPYAYWSVDIAVSFDKDVKAGDVILFGKYNSVLYNNYDMAIPVPMDVQAGESVRLIKTGFELMGVDGHIPYVELCQSVQDFLCGAVYTGTQELTMDVQLVVYDEEGTEHLFGAEQSYTFPETDFDDYADILISNGDFELIDQPYAADTALASLESFDPAAFDFDDLEVDTNPDHMKGLQKNEDGSYTLLTGREYKVTDENAADTPYSKWSVDIAVTFDKDVKAGEVILFGKYYSPVMGKTYDMAIPVPMDVKAGESIRLMSSAFKLLGMDNSYISYEECCASVQDLLCGAVYTGTQELTMTAQLMVYETELDDAMFYREVGEPHLVGEAQTYTFPATAFDDYVEQLIEDGSYNVQPAAEEDAVLDNSVISVETAQNAKGLKVEDGQVILENATEFALDDTNAANTPYADWAVDFRVSLDKAVNANEVTLLGRYDSDIPGYDGRYVPVALKAMNSGSIMLLDAMAKELELGSFKVDYAFLAEHVKDFICGAYYTGDQELTITVQLVAIDNEGKTYDVGEPQTYLFSSFESYIKDGGKYTITAPETVLSADVLANILPSGVTADKVKGLNVENGTVTLDSATEYKITDANAANCDYADWNVDFLVSFSKPVAAGTVTLLGCYDTWAEGAWIPVTLGAVADGETVRLLETVGEQITGSSVTVNYSELCSNVQDFLCGAVYTGAGDLAMTVQLVAYDNDGVAHYVDKPVSYVFEDFASHIEDLKERTNEEGEPIVVIDELTKNAEFYNIDIDITEPMYETLVTQLHITPNADGTVSGTTPSGKQIDELQGVTIKNNDQGEPEITLDSGRCYVLNEDTTEEAEAYNDWHIDYEVWFESDIEKESIVLMGNYGGYDWIPFWNPEAIQGGNENVQRLISGYGAEMMGYGQDNTYITYETLYTSIQKFACGAAYAGKDKLVMHVDLYAYETDASGNETGVKHLIDAHAYTFGGDIQKYTEEIIEEGNGYIGPVTGETPEEIAEKTNISGVSNLSDVVKEAGAGVVVELTKEELTSMKGASVDEDGNVHIDSAREYSVNDPKAATVEYADWNLDFVVSFNKALVSYADYLAGNGDTVVLMGSYGDWGWIPISMPNAVAANQDVPLLATAGFTVNYEELNEMENFICGALYTGKDEMTMTVNLVAYGEDENGAPATYVLDSYEYKFEATPIPKVAEINGEKFETVNKALSKVNSIDGDVVINILDDIEEADESNYFLENNVTITADKPVVIDFVAGEDSILIQSGKTLTIDPEITIKNIWGLYAGLNNAGTVDLYGTAIEEQLWAVNGGVFNVKPGAQMILSPAVGGDGMIKLRGDCTLNVTGEIEDASSAVLADTVKSVDGGFFSGDKAGTKNVNIKDAYVSSWWFTEEAGTLNLSLDNSILELKFEVDRGFSSSATSNISLTNGSRVISDKVTLGANDAVNIELGSTITTKSITNAGVINVDMTGATEDSYTIISCSGTASYGTAGTNYKVVGSNDYELVVDGNNLKAVKKTYVAQIGTTKFETLDAALAAVKSGETLEIIEPGEYTVETLSGGGYTIEAVDGVVFNHTPGDYKWIASCSSPVTVKNITWNVGNAGYQYFSNVFCEDCTINGIICSHGTDKFTNCEFYNAEGYNMWAYGNNVTCIRCKFTCPGDTAGVVNAYNEAQQTPIPTVTFTDCEFNALNTSSKYSAVYIKSECSQNIVFSNCTANENFFTNAISGSKVWGLKDTSYGGTITVDEVVVWPVAPTVTFASNLPEQVTSVGNANTLTAGDLFKVTGDEEVTEAVRIEVVSDTPTKMMLKSAALGATEGDWTTQTVSFAGKSGAVTVNLYYGESTTPAASISLNVIDGAYNVKSAEDIQETAAKYVLLADVTLTDNVKASAIYKNDYTLTANVEASGEGLVIDEEPYTAPALKWTALDSVVGVTYDATAKTVSFNEGTAFDANALKPTDDTVVTGTVDVDEYGEYTVTYTVTDTFADVTVKTVYSVTVEVIEVIPTFATKFVNTDKYLYRVGNVNNVALDSLFSAAGKVRANKVSVEVTNVAGNAAGTFTASSTDWTAGTIKFTGTGVVSVALKYGDATKLSLTLEVVDATNVTTYSELKNKNSVLLNDIEMSSGGIYDLSNASLYGNGFTFDVRNAAHEISGNAYESTNGVVRINNATIDNVSIVGKPYTDYTGTAKTEWNFACVLVNGGNNVIANSYVSNCGAPVRARGGAKLLLKNTTLKGGTFSNLDIRSGAQITADGLTTINQVNMNDAAENGNTYVGLGIVIYYEGISGNESFRIIGDGLTQYNSVAKNQSGNAVSMAGMAWNSVFGINSKFRYSDGTTEWVNTGILILSRDVPKENITAISGYDWENVSLLGQSGYAYIPLAKTPTSSEEDFDPNAQYPVAPSYSFEYPTAAGKKNYLAKTEESKNYCYYDSAQGAILIGFEKGDSFSFDPRILTVTKNGASITPVITMNGQTYTDSIPFTEGGEYTITYTYTDPYNYGANGAAAQSVTYTKSVNIVAVAADKTLEPASFDFNGKGYKIAAGNDNKTYVMPNIDDSAVDGLNYVKKTVGGQTVYYPVVCVRNGSVSTTTSINGSALGKSATNTALVMVFDGIVTITDNGKTYGSSNTNMADGKLSAVESGLKSALVWSSSNSYDTEPDVVNNKQCYKSASIQGVNRTQEAHDVEYIYRDDAGNEYHYFVKYVFPAKGTGTNAYYTSNATFTVTVNCGANGTVDNTTIKGVKYGTALTADLNKLMNGTKVIATATPNEGYAASWSGTTSSVTKDTTVTLSFKRECTLTINCGEGGTVNTQTITGISEGAKLSVNGNDLLVNDAVVATATPASGGIANWSIPNTTVSDDMTIGLTFVTPVTITITAGSNGSVSPTSVKVAPGKKLTSSGANLSYDGVVIATATANSGYDVGSWSGVPTTAITADTSVSISFSAQSTTCLVEGTMITLANGTQKAVENLDAYDKLLVFNHETGDFDEAYVSYMFHKDEDARDIDVVNLQFANGEIFRFYFEHVLFDRTLNKYVILSPDNYVNYIGHEFCYYDGENLTQTALEGAFITNEHLRIFSPISYYHMNCFANGFLSIPEFMDGLYNIFDYDENMKYDEAQMAEDIANIGLFTYEDLSDYTTPEQFAEFPTQFLKISFAKELTTLELRYYYTTTYCTDDARMVRE